MPAPYLTPSRQDRRRSSITNLLQSATKALRSTARAAPRPPPPRSLNPTSFPPPPGAPGASAASVLQADHSLVSRALCDAFQLPPPPPSPSDPPLPPLSNEVLFLSRCFKAERVYAGHEDAGERGGGPGYLGQGYLGGAVGRTLDYAAKAVGGREGKDR